MTPVVGGGMAFVCEAVLLPRGTVMVVVVVVVVV